MYLIDEEGSSKRRISTMEEYNPKRGYDEVPSDVVSNIFNLFKDTTDRTSAITLLHCRGVCRAWSSVLCDPQHWNTIDLSTFEPHFIKMSIHPWVYVSEKTDVSVNYILNTALSLSRRSTTTLFFNLTLYLRDELLAYTAERTPKLKRLVLPAWNRISTIGISKAIASWKDLESLTIGNIDSYYFNFLMSQISTNCSNFSKLKLIGTLDNFASVLVRCVPKLRVLSLRCSKLLKNDLITLFDGLPDLEVLNISHCVLPDSQTRWRIPVSELCSVTLGKAFKSRRFIACMNPESCIMCQRAIQDEGIIRRYKYEEGL